MTPEPTKEPLILKEDSHRGESRALNISLRGWIALIIVLTLCGSVVWLVFNLPKADSFQEASHFVEIIFLPVVSAVITCYFASKSNQSKP